MIVGVTGASGYVGQFIVNALLGNGFKVRALSRHSHYEYFEHHPKLEWQCGSLIDEAALRAFVDGLDVVIHAAFEHDAGRYRYGEGENLGEFLSVNLNGSLRLMQLAYAAKVSRFITLSSRAVYSPTGVDGVQSEHHSARPNTFYGAYKAALDNFVTAWAEQYDWHICSLRPTGVYGVVQPLANTKWYDFVKAVIQEKDCGPDRTATEVHGTDVAKAVLLLMSEDDSKGKRVNCSDILTSRREIAEIVQALTGTSGPLPDSSENAPSAIMDCDYLQNKGFTFAGKHGLRKEIERLVDAIGLESVKNQ